jgi:hypothetical protein
MRVFIVCALVAAGFAYYMVNQDTDRSGYLQPGAKPGDIMNHCIKQKKYAAGADDLATSLEATCAAENNLRWRDGQWIAR